MDMEKSMFSSRIHEFGEISGVLQDGPRRCPVFESMVKMVSDPVP